VAELLEVSVYANPRSSCRRFLRERARARRRFACRRRVLWRLTLWLSTGRPAVTQASGHAFATTTDRDGGNQYKALAAFLNDGAIVWRRSLQGFTDEFFDVWAQQFSSFARSYYPGEAKILSLDGAKVHLSPAGLLTLLRANVHVIAEPSNMSHILQALDNSSVFGRYSHYPRKWHPCALFSPRYSNAFSRRTSVRRSRFTSDRSHFDRERGCWGSLSQD